MARLLSEATEGGLYDLRRRMSRYADARALGLDELEEFMTEVTRGWNSAPFAGGVAEFAQQRGNCGVATWGDLRELDRDILCDNFGMSPVHAKRFEKLSRLGGGGRATVDDSLKSLAQCRIRRAPHPVVGMEGPGKLLVA